MKTLTEALKCLNKAESDSHEMTRADVFVDENGIGVEATGPGADTAGMQSIVELGKEIAIHPEVQAIGRMIICCMLGVTKPGDRVTTSAETANMLSSLWATAFTYGVRVGIEMEKSEEPMPV